MELNEYQMQAMTTCAPTANNFVYMMLNLIAESGELAGKAAKAIRKGEATIDWENNLRQPSSRHIDEELEEAGMLRQGIKHSFRVAQERAQEVHQRAYMMLHGASGTAARSYNNELEQAWRRMDDAVLLAPPERAYNMVVALVRLIERLNGELSGRYDFAPARVLYCIPERLACTGIADRRIDRIIEICTKDE